MTTYVLRTLEADYYSSWQYHCFFSHLSKEAIIEAINKKMPELHILQKKIETVYNDIFESAEYSHLTPAQKDDAYVKLDDQLRQEVNELGWVQFNSNTGIALTGEMCDVTVDCLSTLDEWVESNTQRSGA